MLSNYIVKYLSARPMVALLLDYGPLWDFVVVVPTGTVQVEVLPSGGPMAFSAGDESHSYESPALQFCRETLSGLDTGTRVWQDECMTDTTTTTNLTTAERDELETLEAAFDLLGGRGVEIAERIDQLRAKRDLLPVIDPLAADKALAFVVAYGRMLDAKDEWEMEDNFETTESVYELYQQITGQA